MPEQKDANTNIFNKLDTTESSLLHKVFHGPLANKDASILQIVATVYISVLAVTMVPLYLAALYEFPLCAKPGGPINLHFFNDWNVHFMSVFSLPMIISFIVTDQLLLRGAMQKLVKENILCVSSFDVSSWNKRFRDKNLLIQFSGVVIGSAIAYINYVLYSNPEVGFWFSMNRPFPFTGWIYLYCIFLFYWAVSVYVLRTFLISRFLFKIVNKSEIKLVPLHPDHCGGLHPVGLLGLRNQYMLSVLGINLIIIYLVYFPALSIFPGNPLYCLQAAAVTAYIILGPIVFVLPMLPFRLDMMKYKDDWMEEITAQFRNGLDSLRSKLKTMPPEKTDEELIERFRKISAMIEEMPVWPFDARTIKKFITAYLVPLATSILFPMLKKLIGAP